MLEVYGISPVFATDRHMTGIKMNFTESMVDQSRGDCLHIAVAIVREANSPDDVLQHIFREIRTVI